METRQTRDNITHLDYVHSVDLKHFMRGPGGLRSRSRRHAAAPRIGWTQRRFPLRFESISCLQRCVNRLIERVQPSCSMPANSDHGKPVVAQSISRMQAAYGKDHSGIKDAPSVHFRRDTWKTDVCYCRRCGDKMLQHEEVEMALGIKGTPRAGSKQT